MNLCMGYSRLQLVILNFLGNKTPLLNFYFEVFSDWSAILTRIMPNFVKLMRRFRDIVVSLGNLSKDVFERRTSTGSEVFSLLICLDANKFVLLSFSSLIKTIYPRFSTEPLPNDAKSPLPVDVRRSKTLLLKLPFVKTTATTTRTQ